MENKLGLDYDEAVIISETSVSRGVAGPYTDELFLTNKKLICISTNRGFFSGGKKTYHYPLDQIKVFNGIPQVRQGKCPNGSPSLDIYFFDGEEHFSFSSGGKKKIPFWIEEIQKLFGITQFQGNDYPLENDDSVLGAFKEVGESFKDIGRELAESFGFRFKNKKNTTSESGSGKSNIACSNCGNKLHVGSKFCNFCGTPVDNQAIVPDSLLEIVCPKCGKILPKNLRFCTECGTDLDSKPNSASDIQTTESGIIPEKAKLTIDQQIELLQKLKALVDTGTISPEEFEQKKKEILQY